MANHVQNRLVIKGTNKEIAKAMDYIKGDDGEVIDFEKIKPMSPKNMNVEWARANWGTKWLAYDQDDKRTKGNEIYFKTAWSPPDILIVMLSKLFPNVSFCLDYADEHKGERAGSLKAKAGKEVYYKKLKNFSKESINLFYELYPHKKRKTKQGVNGLSMLSQKNTITKTAGQKRNIARLKKVQKIAKQLKAANPRLSHTEAVSKAWKQM